MGSRSGRGLGSHGAQNGEADVNQLVMPRSVELETEKCNKGEGQNAARSSGQGSPPRSRPPGREMLREAASILPGCRPHGGARPALCAHFVRFCLG